MDYMPRTDGPSRATLTRLLTAKRQRAKATAEEIRFLQRSGILASLCRASQYSEPDFHELMQLVDPTCPRLASTIENYANKPTSAVVTMGILSSVGLSARLLHGRHSREDLVETWEAMGREGSKPRSGAPWHEVQVAIDGPALRLWSGLKLSSVDYPMNKHPIVSALFLGRPFHDILAYYVRIGDALPSDLVSSELSLYAGAIDRWVMSVSKPGAVASRPDARR